MGDPTERQIAPAEPRRATSHDLERIVEILASSHEHYVWEEWLFPEEGRHDAIARLMGLTTRLVAIPHGEVWIAGSASVAVWLPPIGHDLDDTTQRELDTTFAAVFGDRLHQIGEVDQAVASMRPRERHWTLGTMGTLPTHQGQGLGTGVLEPKLRHLDETGVCAALETSTEANVRFYERLGFTPIAYDDQLPHGAPPVWTMWRDPA